MASRLDGAKGQGLTRSHHSAKFRILKQLVRIQKPMADAVGEAVDNLSTTVVRAMALLDVLVAEPRGLTLTEAARRANFHKATAFRFLGSFQRTGLVVHDPLTSLYRPGLKLVRMAEQMLEALDFRTVSRPFIQQLAQTVGQGVLAGVLEGLEVVYVDHVEGSDGLRVHREIGGRRAVHLSSIGRAIVAHLPPAEAERIVGVCPLERRTPHTLVDRTAFRVYLEVVRAQGWAVQRDEDRLGVTSFAAPVFDHTARVVGAIGITGPSFVLHDALLDAEVERLLDACRAASAELGYVGNIPVARVAVRAARGA